MSEVLKDTGKDFLTPNSRYQVQHGSNNMSSYLKRVVQEKKEHSKALEVLKSNGVLLELSEMQILDEVLKCMKEFKKLKVV